MLKVSSGARGGSPRKYKTWGPEVEPPAGETGPLTPKTKNNTILSAKYKIYEVLMNEDARPFIMDTASTRYCSMHMACVTQTLTTNNSLSHHASSSMAVGSISCIPKMHTATQPLGRSGLLQ